MKSEEERCAEAAKFRRMDDAFRAGDLAALRAAVDDPAAVPNGPMPMTIGSCLVYAIYHSPLRFIRTLLESGADPNAPADDGFPPLIAALSCTNDHPGSKARPDVREILALLIEFGADPNQRGINDYTALHMAVGERNRAAVELLLEAGADPTLRTRIDDRETPREIAEAAGLHDLAGLLFARERAGTK
jgi:ankyrin repeat protein